MKRKIAGMLLSGVLFTQLFASYFVNVSANNQIEVNSSVTMEIKEYYSHNLLDTDHESMTYEGDLVITNYRDVPSNEHQYVVVSVEVDVPSSAGGYDLDDLSISHNGKMYNVLESGFLKNHGYKPITSTTLTPGFHSGDLVFEVPSNIDISELSLIFTGGV